MPYSNWAKLVPYLKDKYPNFGAQMHSYGESILTCVFLYNMKKR